MNQLAELRQQVEVKEATHEGMPLDLYKLEVAAFQSTFFLHSSCWLLLKV